MLLVAVANARRSAGWWIGRRARGTKRGADASRFDNEQSAAMEALIRPRVRLQLDGAAAAPADDYVNLDLAALAGRVNHWRLRLSAGRRRRLRRLAIESLQLAPRLSRTDPRFAASWRR